MRNFSKLFRFAAAAAVITSVFAGCLSYTVDFVEVSVEGNEEYVDAGKAIKFNFLVTASGKDTSQAQRVKWSVSSTNDGRGPVTPGTAVSPGGTLSVSIDEIYPVLYVRATHEAYAGKYDFKQIQVKGPKVGSVVLSSAAASVVAGGTLKVSAFVAGQAPHQGLTYSVGSKNDGTGAVTTGTRIAADGTLTVAAAETASSLYVKAVSNSDATKSDIKEIKIITVTSVTVSAEGGTARVIRGSSLKLSAVVAGTNNPSQNVTWKVSSSAAGTGAVTAGTTIATDGTLTAATAEAAAALYVTATSAIDATKSGSITVTIPTVTSVTITPANPQIKRGEGVTFAARVQGTGNPGQEVTWKLDGVGGAPSATAITSNGMLIVSPAETLSQLIVTAFPVDDPTKSGTTMITIPAVPAAVVPVTAPPATSQPGGAGFTGYIITGSGTTFTAVKNGAAIGTANQPIQTVINDIRTDAAGQPVWIQFGNGDGVLNIESGIDFNNTGGTWGAITLSGKISGSRSSVLSGTIYVLNNISVTSTADITNASSTRAVYFDSTGTLTIAGGTVKAAASYAIQNNSSGTVNITGGTVQGGMEQNIMARGGVRNQSSGTINISGGTVQTESGWAVFNYYAGMLNITGGTVSAATGIALYLEGAGKVTVSGTARVTSANTKSDEGTINFGTTYTSTALRLEITGGTVENTANGGTVINNKSKGAVTISGGTVKAAAGFAIKNPGGGALNTSGARIEGQIGS